MVRFAKVLCWILLAAFVLAMTAGFCSLGQCQEPSVEAAKARLQEIEKQKQAAKDLADAKAAEELRQQSLEVAASLVPVPDPISKAPPTITFSQPVKATADDRLPRAVLVCGQRCSPCLKMEAELEGLVGGADAPIQVVQNWKSNDLEKWGITPGMQLGTPYLFVLDKDGNVHSLSPNGLGCVLRGYHDRAAVVSYLMQPEHGVDILRLPEDDAPVVATVEGGDTSPATFAAVLSAHLLESSGKQTTDEQYLYGGLFSFDVDVPESWKSIGAKVLKAQTIEFPAAGLKLDWTGQKRTFSVSATSIEITPSIKATVNKWYITYGCGLDGFQFEPDLSSVTVLLTGAPDLTVNLK